MSNLRPKPPSTPLPHKLLDDAKAWGSQLVQRLFGLTQGWEKHRDIVRNNYELGCRHLALGNIRDAILRFKLLTWLDPKHADGWYKLGCAYMADGKKALAKKVLLRSLQLKPTHEEAIYMLALSGGTIPADRAPKRIPLSLAQPHFERLAAGFTQAQLETYHYQGHKLLCQAIRADITPGRIDCLVLELGVGTGLCGPLMRDIAAQITGVDFSGAMLAQAMALQDDKGKKIYDALVKREIQEFLPGAAAESYDIVMAAGVFSYVGDLSDLYPQVVRVLKPGGIFAFTVDKMDGGGMRLDAEAARFRFSKTYLDTLAATNGLNIVRCEEAPVYPQYDAWLCLLKKTP